MMETELFEKIIELTDQGKYQEAEDLANTFLLEHNGEISGYFPLFLKLVEKNWKYRIELSNFDFYISLAKVYQYIVHTYAQKPESLIRTECCHSNAGNNAADGNIDKQLCEMSTVQHIKTKQPRTIWWCWLQGYDTAPLLVKACFQSLKTLGLPICVITAQNFGKYISLPDYILEKWKNKIIPNAQFSDLLRIALLTEYGGLWIDSTVLVTEGNQIPCLENDGLFCFRHIMRGFESNFISASNWWLSAPAQDQILLDTQTMLYDYWRKENQLIHYFLFHLFFTVSCRKNAAEWRNVPTISNVPPHIMQEELMQPYTPEGWERLCQTSGIHKLSWKIARPETDQYLIYDYIIDHYLK